LIHVVYHKISESEDGAKLYNKSDSSFSSFLPVVYVGIDGDVDSRVDKMYFSLRTLRDKPCICTFSWHGMSSGFDLCGFCVNMISLLFMNLIGMLAYTYILVHM
jgi:hypothetical protein